MRIWGALLGDDSQLVQLRETVVSVMEDSLDTWHVPNTLCSSSSFMSKFNDQIPEALQSTTGGGYNSGITPTGGLEV